MHCRTGFALIALTLSLPAWVQAEPAMPSQPPAHPSHGMMGRPAGDGHPPRVAPMPRRGGPANWIDRVEELDLKPEQRKKVEALAAEYRTLNQQQFETMRGEQMRLRELYQADHWDAKAIGEAYDGLYKKRRVVMMKTVEIRNKVYDLLTTEQRAELKAPPAPPQAPPAQQPPAKK